MQQSDGERGTRSHAAASRQVTVVMNLDAAIHFQETQSFARRRMSQFIQRLNRFHFRIHHARPMLKERRQVATGQITIFVDGRRQHRAAVLAIPGRVIRAAAKKRDSVWSAADNHGSASIFPETARVPPDKILGQRQRFRCAYIQKGRVRHANFHPDPAPDQRREDVRLKTQRRLVGKKSNGWVAKQINPRVDDTGAGLFFIEPGQFPVRILRNGSITRRFRHRHAENRAGNFGIVEGMNQFVQRNRASESPFKHQPGRRLVVHVPAWHSEIHPPCPAAGFRARNSLAPPKPAATRKCFSTTAAR